MNNIGSYRHLPHLIGPDGPWSTTGTWSFWKNVFCNCWQTDNDDDNGYILHQEQGLPKVEQLIQMEVQKSSIDQLKQGLCEVSFACIYKKKYHRVWDSSHNTYREKKTKNHAWESSFRRPRLCSLMSLGEVMFHFLCRRLLQVSIQELWLDSEFDLG